MFGKQLVKKINEHRVTGLAAEQAYYYLFSLFPLLILLLSTLPYLSINSQIALDFLNDFAPSQITGLIEDTIVTVLNKRNSGLLTIGVVGTIWSASNGMNAFIHSMNIAFEVKETRNYLITHLLSIFLTFGLIFSLIIALALPVFGNTIFNLFDHFFPLSASFQGVFNVARWVIASIVIPTVISYLYQMAPNIHLPFRHVFVGAITATILWLILLYGFSIYVNNFANYSATYGSLGGVIILILWLYLTGLSLIIGGEINAILYRNISIPHSKKQLKHFFHQKEHD